MINRFEEFNLDKNIIKSLKNMKYEIPSKVQSKVIPQLLNNKDIIVKSKTGSGKTASFAIPLCEKVDINNNSVQGLIIAPTRELALQIKEEVQNIGRIKKVRCSAIFGKQPLKEQVAELKQRVHIVVATPGRIIDHIGRGTIDLSNIKFFIIDEADKMLNKGFVDDMESIMTKLPQNACKGMFSATIDDNINSVCEKYMKNIIRIEIKDEDKYIKKQISEFFINSEEENKYDLLKSIIYKECPHSVIVFANTRDKVDEIYKSMKKDKFTVGVIHGDMSQDKRLFIIKDFKENKFNILVSSDITSRGIHVDDVSLVINYEVPRDKENYVHRIGRTGRVDKLGKAITIVSTKEEKYLREIEEYTKNQIEEISSIDEREVSEGKDKFKILQENLLKNRKSNINKKENQEVTKIYLNVGKKKKIRVIDIVGAFSNIEGINNEDIGVIEVKDTCSYVDILNYKGENFLKNNKTIIIKKKQVKVKRDNS
ncbi:MAG: DEAD/DEAH box helicase [Clostridiales bacterium]|uniref:DEAD/DEAH box helicase n=1 Tax=Terrisporobacter sp. TaxID=1965305 RepID=UPI002A58FE1D|nr:DEAD/DEAH box helicase [Terrisporobacter sp.]MDD7755434.1 DEAD/DEAH box helicase [Clostridiales bacterium]MDY4133738.1 DEAD/DEAH box helicase [Terrisporobacter sp.]